MTPSLFGLKIVFVEANSVDPDEMLYMYFVDLGLNCLSKNAFISHQYTMGCCLKKPNKT